MASHLVVRGSCGRDRLKLCSTRPWRGPPLRSISRLCSPSSVCSIAYTGPTTPPSRHGLNQNSRRGTGISWSDDAQPRFSPSVTVASSSQITATARGTHRRVGGGLSRAKQYFSRNRKIFGAEKTAKNAKNTQLYSLVVVLW